MITLSNLSRPTHICTAGPDLKPPPNLTPKSIVKAMGGCNSVESASFGHSSLRGSIALGPTPSVLPGREKFDDVHAKYTFEKASP